MSVPRFEGVLSALVGQTAPASAPVAVTTPLDAVGVVGIAGGSEMRLVAVGVVVLLAVASGALIVLRRRQNTAPTSSDASAKSSSFGGKNDSSSSASTTAAADRGSTGSGQTQPTAGGGGTQSSATGTTDASAAFDDRIGERTLDRLDPVAPDAVQRVRDRLPLDRNTTPETVDSLARTLRQAIEDALDDGQFDPAVESSRGGVYEVVNLPGRFRELTVPPAGETVHVADLEGAVRDALDRYDLHEAARTVAAVHDHCRDIESHIRRREESYLDERRDAERTLDDIREMTDRFDGALAERMREFVVDGRHDALPGVVDIERRLDAADRSLHGCAFDDADRTVTDAARAADDLLMAVDFLGGVTGTIDHGSGRVTVPDGVDDGFVADLVPILERQYPVSVEFDGSAVVVTGGASGSDGGDISSTGTGGSRRGSERSTDPPTPQSSTDTDRSGSGSREQLTPDAVADEILYVFRELAGRGGSNAVECQTERLPDGVARRDVLEPLATFCRRQTDLVDSVTLQENAPPGFFEIEFREGTTAADGIDALRDRFTERHGT